MDKQQIGLSPKSIAQLERVIDTADVLLYPAHLVIGGWRMLAAAIILAVSGICYGAWWLVTNLYNNGLVSTVVSIGSLMREFPIGAVLIGLAIVVPVFILLLPVAGWFTQLMYILWVRIFGINRKPGLVSGAEIITMGYDPNDFDFEEINGVIYGRKRGTYPPKQ